MDIRFTEVVVGFYAGKSDHGPGFESSAARLRGISYFYPQASPIPLLESFQGGKMPCSSVPGSRAEFLIESLIQEN